MKQLFIALLLPTHIFCMKVKKPSFKKKQPPTILVAIDSTDTPRKLSKESIEHYRKYFPDIKEGELFLKIKCQTSERLGIIFPGYFPARVLDELATSPQNMEFSGKEVQLVACQRIDTDSPRNHIMTDTLLEKITHTKSPRKVEKHRDWLKKNLYNKSRIQK